MKLLKAIWKELWIADGSFEMGPAYFLLIVAMFIIPMIMSFLCDH